MIVRVQRRIVDIHRDHVGALLVEAPSDRLAQALCRPGDEQCPAFESLHGRLFDKP